VVGTATFADGRPLPEFKVSAEGGMGGGGETTGSNGQYALEITEPDIVIVRNVQGKALLNYRGVKCQLPLDPTDGKSDEPGGDEFRGDLTDGVVRNFVLRTSGPKPGADRSIPNVTTADEFKTHHYFYGGEIKVEVVGNGVPAGANVTITLTPTGPLMDGTAAQPLERTITGLDPVHYYFLIDLPLGTYTASANYTENGTKHPLHVRSRMYGSDEPSTDTPQDSTPIDWPLTEHGDVQQFSPMLTISP
jgi:hypothetical protein